MLKQYRMILTITKEYFFLLHFTDKRKEKSRTFIALACCTKSLVSHNIKHSKTSGKDSRCSEKILVKQKFIIVSLTSTCDFFSYIMDITIHLLDADVMSTAFMYLRIPFLSFLSMQNLTIHRIISWCVYFFHNSSY